MQEIVVIDGEIELENTLDGEVELETITDLDPEVVLSAGGGVTPSGTIEITENGTYNVRDYAEADVDVQGGITPTGTKQININSNGTTTEDVTDYANAEINVNVSASAVDTGTKNISTNGTHDVVGYANASVNVPNSYSQSDEGKVVSNGALVAQSSQTITENGTYDTTLKDEVVVNVSGGGGAGLTKLNEFSITSAVREVSVAITSDMVANYDEFVCFYTFTSSYDWMYFNVDATALVNSPARYDVKSTSHTGIRVVQRGIQYESDSPNFSFSHRSKTMHFFQHTTISAHTLTFIMYNANSTINSGKVLLYGVNYANLR